MKCSRRRETILRFVSFVFLCACPVRAAHADVTAMQQLKLLSAEVPANRAILTVGREVFSSVDAVAMIMAWNMTLEKSEKPVAHKTDWIDPQFLTRTAVGDPMVSLGSWPEDLSQFFQISLIWVDIQKLNLFVLRPQDIVQNLAKFTLSRNELSAGAPESLAREVFGASESVRAKWIECVLRVRAFIRARGNLDRNRNLYSVGWYWHHMPAGLRIAK